MVLEPLISGTSLTGRFFYFFFAAFFFAFAGREVLRAFFISSSKERFVLMTVPCLTLAFAFLAAIPFYLTGLGLKSMPNFSFKKSFNT